MKIYLVRHGDYIHAGAHNLGELSPRGRSDLQKISDFLKPLRLSVSHIYHSGKIRAQQTAEILAQCFVSTNPPESKKGLDPEDSVDGVFHELSSLDEDILLVGHLPFMGRLLAKLVANDETKTITEFTTSTCVCIEGDTMSYWKINWIIKPELFNANS